MSRGVAVTGLLLGVAVIVASIALALFASSVQAATGPASSASAHTAWLSGLAALSVLLMLSLILHRQHSHRTDHLQACAQRDSAENDSRDFMTGAATARRAPTCEPVVLDMQSFDNALRRHWHNCSIQSSFIAVAYARIDNFRTLTDAIGQERLDRRIDQMTRSLGSLVEVNGGLLTRDFDGGIIALLPNVTPDDALETAEDLRISVEDLGFDPPPSKRGVMTVSVGLSIAVPSTELKRDQFLNSGMRALARARTRGGNRVETEMLDSQTSFRA